MAQTGYTPIQLYYSSTPGAVPNSGNMAPGELAINIADGKLFYEDTSGVIQTLANKATSGGTSGTSILYGNGSGGFSNVTVGSGLSFTGGTLSATSGGGGTVTSVGLSLPSVFNVTGSPVTTSGTLDATLASQTANTIFAAPNGTTGAPVFRALVAADIPALPYSPTAGSASITTLGTVTTGTWNATAISISSGGTGQTSKTAGFNALSPLTTLGDTVYHNGTDSVRLAGNVTAAKQFFTQTGTGTASAAPIWSALVNSDIPSTLTGKTYNGLSLTSNGTGFSVAGGTTSKTLTISNSITLAGTDGTTITLPASTGTVALNNQSFFLGTTSVAINRSSGSLSLSGVSIDGTAANLAGGAANRIAYQTGAGSTAFIAAPSSANTLLQWNGSAFSWAATPSPGGMTLLGTLTTTSGSTSTLSGLDLTSYKQLLFCLNNVSTGLSTSQLELGGVQVTGSLSTTANGWTGIFPLDLSTGVFGAGVTAIPSGISGSASGNGRTSINNSSTSVTFSVSSGSFDAGSIQIYGMK